MSLPPPLLLPTLTKIAAMTSALSTESAAAQEVKKRKKRNKEKGKEVAF